MQVEIGPLLNNQHSAACVLAMSSRDRGSRWWLRRSRHPVLALWLAFQIMCRQEWEHRVARVQQDVEVP